MIGKIAVSVASLLLVVGVAIRVVFVMKTNAHSQEHESIHSSTKMITSICEMTKYKEACIASLEPTANNSSATAKDYILTAVGATLDEVTKSLDFVNKEKDPYNYVAVQHCKFYLEYAVDMLQASISLVVDSSPHTIEDNEHELLSWMSAVYALEEYCRDPTDNPGFKSAIQNRTSTAFQLTHNAVNILAQLSQVLKLFNVQQPGNQNALAASSHRRLLSADGYPTWFKAADRRLLAEHASSSIRPDVVVAKDGSGHFKTIGQAVATYPANHQGRFTIYVKAGVYDEQVIIDRYKPYIFIYGDGIDKTIITGNKNCRKMNISTPETATFANEAVGFLAKGITIKNEAGPEGLQAVALRSGGDQSAFFNCSFEGFQDTLFYEVSRQFYRSCRIYGTIDFIFGKGEALLQDCDIIVRRPLPYQFNVVTADGRGHHKGSNGLVIQNCRIVPDNFLSPIRFQVQTYLGRPWTLQARTVVMQSHLEDFIHPEGWRVWDGKDHHKTCEVYEYLNRGPGANTDTRNKLFLHFKVLETAEAVKFTAGPFLGGDKWLWQTNIPFRLGLWT